MKQHNMTDDDPDETEGRKLYRAQADKLASSQIAKGKRRWRITEDDLGRPVPHHGSGCVTAFLPSDAKQPEGERDG